MLSMNGQSPTISTAPPFVPSLNSGRALRPSKGERSVFQQIKPDTRNLKPYTLLPLSRLRYHVYHRRFTAFDNPDRFVESRSKLIGFSNGAKPLNAQCAGNGR
jgi:hypothetical protein